MMAKGAWSKLAALCACTVAAAALSSCGAVAKKEPQAQAAATAEDGAVLRAVTVVDGDSLTLEGQTLYADEADQSVLVVKNGGSVVLRNCTITKTGSTADSASATEGINAALVAQSGGNLVLENCTIETDGAGASALAAVGDNACVVVSDTTITTRQEASAGVMAAANGCILAQNLTIETQGAYSPMLYAGTGSGTIQASGVEGRSSGAYAPCVYSRGTLMLEDSEMVAYASACAVLEGANSLSLTQTALESQGSEMGVLVFQPDAGQVEQADSGMAELWVSGGRVTAAQGAALYVTNTKAYICITDSAEVLGGSGVAVKAAAGQWGSSGNNGGRLVLRSDGAMEGDIEYDSLSSVETVPAEETETSAKMP